MSQSEPISQVALSFILVPFNPRMKMQWLINYLLCSNSSHQRLLKELYELYKYLCSISCCCTEGNLLVVVHLQYSTAKHLINILLCSNTSQQRLDDQDKSYCICYCFSRRLQAIKYYKMQSKLPKTYAPK